MGDQILFYENGEFIGGASFSMWSATRQMETYGMSYHDCIVYLHAGDEYVGPRHHDGTKGVYQPAWFLCLARARKLLRLAEASTDEHRRDYDTQPYTVPALVALLERCVKSPYRDRCYIQLC